MSMIKLRCVNDKNTNGSLIAGVVYHVEPSSIYLARGHYSGVDEFYVKWKDDLRFFLWRFEFVGDTSNWSELLRIVSMRDTGKVPVAVMPKLLTEFRHCSVLNHAGSVRFFADFWWLGSAWPKTVTMPEYSVGSREILSVYKALLGNDMPITARTILNAFPWAFTDDDQSRYPDW